MSDNVIDTDAIVIERVFDAPIDLIWHMWTQPEHFKQWYGPEGFSVPVAEMDVQVGGKRRVGMTLPDGSMTMWTIGEYKEVSPITRLVYTESMADQDGNVMEMPGMPSITEVIVELEAVDGGTRMTMTHAGVPADSPGKSGWEQAFTKLARHIASTA